MQSTVPIANSEINLYLQNNFSTAINFDECLMHNASHVYRPLRQLIGSAVVVKIVKIDAMHKSIDRCCSLEFVCAGLCSKLSRKLANRQNTVLTTTAVTARASFTANYGKITRCN